MRPIHVKTILLTASIQRFTLCVLLVGLLTGMAAKTAFSSDMQGRDAATKALSEIRQNMTISRERVTELANQVDGLKKDQKTLTAELVKAAKSEREAADNISASETKLAKLLMQKDDVQKNLKGRRAEFAEVLAALERMGLNPPPAILVRPDDALASVRSSVLLGAVVPEMREKTLALSASLKELTRVSDSISAERDTLKTEVSKQAEQQKRLGLLLAEKAKLQIKSEAELNTQRQMAHELVEKAKSLEDLVAELDRQSRIQTPGIAGSDDTLKLAENLNFMRYKARLVRPVSGPVVQGFASGNNNSSQGETVETAPGAIVTAPADAVVAYAGPFRSYGQLIILDVGQDYHILLAGMGKIDVQQGQFVLSGEPVGAMGTQLIASATALDIGKSAPMLYIELRKQGKPVNPAPWWMAGVSGRNQNDS